MEGGAPPPPLAKHKPSRAKKRRSREARRRRRALLAALLLLACVLGAGAAFDIPYINALREGVVWMKERLATRGVEEEGGPAYLYFSHPQDARELAGEISILLCVYAGEVEGEPSRDILALALLTYDREEGAGELYLIPEGTAAYDAAGERIDLGHALYEDGGEDLLRSTVGNLAGAQVDYLLRLDFLGALMLLQSLQPPALLLEQETALVSPLDGGTDVLIPGQEIRDADRLILYLLATDEEDTWAAFSARRERAKAYLPRLLTASGDAGAGSLEAALSTPRGECGLEPDAGSARGDAELLASMLRSFAELGEGRLAVRAVPAVEVLNGCGVPDLGRMVGERLSALGVPVAGTGGNAKVSVDGEEVNDFSHERSSVRCRSRDARAQAFARYLAVLLSISDVEAEPGAGPEIVLIAGRDML